MSSLSEQLVLNIIRKSNMKLTKEMIYVVSGTVWDSPGTMGIRKKINDHINAFHKLGYNTTLVYHEKDKLFFQDSNGNLDSYPLNELAYQMGIFASILSRYITEKKLFFDLVYVRKSCTESPFSLRVARILKAHSAKVVYEIPTYPYDEEMKNLLGKPSLHGWLKSFTWWFFGWFICDRIFRRRLKKYIDCFAVITSLANLTSVFGVSAIKMSNGIDVDRIPIKDRLPDNIISLLGVAGVSYWHGYDRIIYGLHNYYSQSANQKRNVVFHIAGEGSALAELKQLVSNFSLDAHVVFHGMVTGNALEELYNHADIGVASFGAFRKKLNLSAELKVREYISGALPYITGVEDIDVPSSTKWKLLFANDDSPIGIDLVLNFYDKCVNNANITNEMRLFAESNLSWKGQLEKVINSLDNK